MGILDNINKWLFSSKEEKDIKLQPENQLNSISQDENTKNTLPTLQIESRMTIELLHAILSGNEEKSKQLILEATPEEINKDIKFSDQKTTLLHIAVERGSKEMVKHLLQGGANVGAKDFNKRTPSEVAAANREPKKLDPLLKYQYGFFSEDKSNWQCQPAIELMEQVSRDLGSNPQVTTPSLAEKIAEALRIEKISTTPDIQNKDNETALGGAVGSNKLSDTAKHTSKNDGSKTTPPRISSLQRSRSGRR